MAGGKIRTVPVLRQCDKGDKESPKVKENKESYPQNLSWRGDLPALVSEGGIGPCAGVLRLLRARLKGREGSNVNKPSGRGGGAKWTGKEKKVSFGARGSFRRSGGGCTMGSRRGEAPCSEIRSRRGKL